MKKIIIFTLLLSFGISCVTASEISKFSSRFVKNFKDCDSYQESTESEYKGETFTTSREIIGWRNGFCKYRETMKSKSGGYQINCNFSGTQVDELYDAMKARSHEPEKFELQMFAEKTDNKGHVKYVQAGTQTIKGNKAFITWAKYQNNPYFCKFQKI